MSISVTTVRARKLAFYGNTTRKRDLPGERNNVMNYARCTQAMEDHAQFG